MSPTRSAAEGRIRIKAYPVAELGGLLCLFKPNRPLVPDWEFFPGPTASARSSSRKFRQLVSVPENSIDPVHSSGRIPIERPPAGATGPYTPQHVKVDFSEFEYGFQYKRIRTDTTAEDCCGRSGGSPVAERAVHRQPHRIPRRSTTRTR
jgi:5,5'-dehydrodivanillate O-demethylase